jgi:hypothetical protein
VPGLTSQMLVVITPTRQADTNKKGDGQEPCSRCQELESACTYGKNTTFIARGMRFQELARLSLIHLLQNGAQWRQASELYDHRQHFEDLLSHQC